MGESLLLQQAQGQLTFRSTLSLPIIWVLGRPSFDSPQPTPVRRTASSLQWQRADVEARACRDPTELIFEGAVLSGGRYLTESAAQVTEGAQLRCRPAIA